MPNKTEYLALNQWEGSDAVLHTDFNDDNLKVEQAVLAINQAASTTGAKLEALKEKEAVDYEFLSFALLNALTLTNLESHYPGDKRGLIYDNFTSLGKTGQTPIGVQVLPDRRYLGMGNAIDEKLLQAVRSHTATDSIPQGGTWQYYFSQTGSGYLKGFSFFCDFGPNTVSMTIKVRRANVAHTQAGEELRSQSASHSNFNGLAIRAFTFTPVYLAPGDYVIELSPSRIITTSRPLHTFVYDSCARANGTFTSIAFPFSNFRDGQVKARVTHDVGTVSVTLIGASGARFPMAALSVEAGTNQEGEACKVSEYSLPDSSTLGDSVTVELLMSSSATQGMRVFDYGVVFL
jgi:hypothetical protein